MPKPENKNHLHLFSLLKFFFGWPLSILALFFVGRIIFSQQNIILEIDRPNIVLLLSGITCFFLLYFARSYVWKLILNELGHNLPLKTVCFLWEISELRRVVPGKLWPFLTRISLFSNVNVSPKTVIKAIVIEIESFVLSAFIISFLGAIFFSNTILANIPYTFFIPLMLIMTLTIIVFIYGSLLTRYVKWGNFSKITSILPNFPPHKNLIILLISIFYLFLFGFGSYLTVASITFVSPEFSLEISIFFIFALIVGYLSFIFPMGLGVRESIIIIGLSKFITLGTAGIASIFARMVLILSELLFLVFAYLWKKTRSKIITNLENFIALHKQEVILGFLITVYFLYFAGTTMLRYDNFYTGQFDLGNMDQAVWNTTQGRIFQTNEQNGEIISRLAVHADFMLVFLSPLYFIWEHPKMLLLVQSAVLALGAIFVFAIANSILKNKNISLAISFVYLFNPAIQFTNLYDFHAVTLVTTFLLGAFYFLYKKQYLLFLLFALLAAITKEQIWVIIALFGIYVFSRSVIARSPEQGAGRRSNPKRLKIASLISNAYNDKEKLLGLITFLVSISIFYFIIWHAIPNAKGGEHFALSYYSEFGESPEGIVKNVFLSPQKTITTFFQKEQLDYLRQLFLPLGFISLLSPLYLVFALPDLLINLLSNNPKLHQIYYQYSAAITPFIFISAIFGVRKLKTWFPKIPNLLITSYLLLLTLYASYAYGPLPFAKKPNIDMFTKPQQNKVEIEAYLSKIPSHYSVAATNNIGSHVSQRQIVYTIPEGANQADIVIFLVNDANAQERFENEINTVRRDKNYKEVYKIDKSFVVFEKLSLAK